MNRLIITAALVLLASAANAQTPIPDPTAVVFNHADFQTATRYDGGYFALPVTAANACDVAATPGANPVLTDNLGKPATATGIDMTAPLVAKPIGCYVYRVRALDGSGLFSAWSDPSDPFVRRPATPGKPVVR